MSFAAEVAVENRSRSCNICQGCGQIAMFAPPPPPSPGLRVAEICQVLLAMFSHLSTSIHVCFACSLAQATGLLVSHSCVQFWYHSQLGQVKPIVPWTSCALDSDVREPTREGLPSAGAFTSLWLHSIASNVGALSCECLLALYANFEEAFYE
eukprot:jgi/Botrbrau1/3322/Bobra.0048s0018.1